MDKFVIFPQGGWNCVPDTDAFAGRADRVWRRLMASGDVAM
jgi:hypothetical protein